MGALWVHLVDLVRTWGLPSVYHWLEPKLLLLHHHVLLLLVDTGWLAHKLRRRCGIVSGGSVQTWPVWVDIHCSSLIVSRLSHWHFILLLVDQLILSNSELVHLMVVVSWHLGCEVGMHLEEACRANPHVRFVGRVLNKWSLAACSAFHFVEIGGVIFLVRIFLIFHFILIIVLVLLVVINWRIFLILLLIGFWGLMRHTLVVSKSEDFLFYMLDLVLELLLQLKEALSSYSGVRTSLMLSLSLSTDS